MPKLLKNEADKECGEEDSIEVARRLTIKNCVVFLNLKSPEKIGNFSLSSQSRVIIDGARRDRAIWAGDLFASGPAALKYLKAGDEIWRNSLLAIGVKQYKDGRLPACLSTRLHYRHNSRFFESYGMWWILSAHEYLERTGDADFKAVFVPILEKTMSYFNTRVGKDFIFKASWPNFYWNCLILRPPDSALINALFYQVLKVADSFGLENPVRPEQFKERFNERFWNNEKSAFMDELSSEAIFLDVNALSILFGLVKEEYIERLFKNLEKFEGDYGPNSYLGRPRTIAGISWHQNLVSPFVAYLYVKALEKAGYPKRAAKIFKQTLEAGLEAVQKYGSSPSTIPEFWKNDGRVATKPATGRKQFRVDYCHGWGTFGDFHPVSWGRLK